MVVCLLGAVTAKAADDLKWRQGTLTATERQKIKEGSTTTPFDMVVLNALDRFHLAKAAVNRLPALQKQAAAFSRALDEYLQEHHSYIRSRGEDMPAIRDWRWDPAIDGNGKHPP